MLLENLRSRNEDTLRLLRRLVELESPSTSKEALDRLAGFLGECLTGVGARVERIPSRTHGDLLRATWGSPGPGQVLVLCHMDTVWPVGEACRRPFRLADGYAWGPGVYDMKGGIAQFLAAMATMRELGLVSARPVVAVLNSEEEVGSPVSRELIEEEGRQSDYCLVLEPAGGPAGQIKTFRKGVGDFRVRVTGRPAHAGADHARGVSATEELAHQILRLHAMTDYEAGVTLNAGVIRGGSRSNVIAADAEAEVDFRVPTMDLAQALIRRVRSLTPVTPGAELTIEGGLNRPPMERTPAIVALFQKARALACELGFDLEEGGTGGASDGNFVAALGTPVLDGLGAVGAGGHALDERVAVDQLPLRAALLVRILQVFP
ncbi:MAG: M20 family metallopeptidase [bacterium]|nr:M20 family metallopeptidase [bacterium]